MKVLDTSIPHELLSYLENLEKGLPNQIKDVVYIKSGEHGYVYRAFEKFCIKVFKDEAQFYGEEECKALEILSNKTYTPKVYAYCPRFILMEWIEGYTLPQYIREFGKVPEDLFKIRYELLCDMVSSFVSNADLKLNEHILWLKDDISKVKVIDFGVVDFLNERSKEYMLNFHKNDYEELKKKSDKVLYNCSQKLLTYGFEIAVIRKFLDCMIL